MQTDILSHEPSGIGRAPAKVGSLVISLDYELFWGVYDSKRINDYRREVEGVHSVFPRILDLFEEFDIQSTIAVVGLLFCESRAEILSNIRSALGEDLSRYPDLRDHLAHVGEDGSKDKLHFDQGILKRIVEDKRHELASHSMTHYYCGEPNSSVVDFEKDIMTYKNILNKYGLSLSSFVFPRNQMRDEYLELLRIHGIRAFRGNPAVGLYRNGSPSNLSSIRRLIRLIDSLVDLSGDLTFATAKNPSTGVVNVPASFFLRPVKSSNSYVAQRQFNRLTTALKTASQQGRCIHLWWHPHNFGVHQEANLMHLREILNVFRELKEEYGFQSRTMSSFIDCHA